MAYLGQGSNNPFRQLRRPFLGLGRGLANGSCNGSGTRSGLGSVSRWQDHHAFLLVRVDPGDERDQGLGLARVGRLARHARGNVDERR
jgi:hypothetical protein